MSCGLSKISLFIFNVCFFLFGAASLGVGIWVLVDKSSLLQLAKVGLKNNTQELENYLNAPSLLQVGAYVLIAIGSFNFVVGFCGCCGAIKESKCLLYIYATLVTFVLLIEIAGAIVVGVYKGKIESELKTALDTTLSQYYIGVPQKDDKSTSGIVSLAWNYAQVLFRCCGVNGPEDYINGTTTVWYTKYRGNTYIPATCCKFNDPDALLANANWWDLPNQMTNKKCPVDVVDYNKDGCIDGIKLFVQRYSTILIAVACGIAGLELIGIIAACCLIRSLKDGKY